MRRAFLILLISVCAAPFAAGAEAPPFEMSADGLYRRESDVFEQLWVRKQFDVHSYHKVMFAPSFIQYRALARDTQTDAAGPKPAPVTTRQKESLQGIVDAAFREELAKSRSFTLTNATGPDVLTVRGDLLDVVSYVPENAAGKDDQLTVPNVGEAILVLELHDSIIERDHGPRERSRGSEHDADMATADEAVRATVQAWATAPTRASRRRGEYPVRQTLNRGRLLGGATRSHAGSAVPRDTPLQMVSADRRHPSA